MLKNVRIISQKQNSNRNNSSNKKLGVPRKTNNGDGHTYSGGLLSTSEDDDVYYYCKNSFSTAKQKQNTIKCQVQTDPGKAKNCEPKRGSKISCAIISKASEGKKSLRKFTTSALTTPFSSTNAGNENGQTISPISNFGGNCANDGVVKRRTAPCHSGSGTTHFTRANLGGRSSCGASEISTAPYDLTFTGSETSTELHTTAAAAIMWKQERMTGNHEKTKRIYTDWANHYLEKAKCKRQIHDLQVDVTDGVVLADVIEAVTTQRVQDIHRKPKSASQMLDNIQSCLVFLSNLGVVLEGINARDIRDGHLKSILSLFFQLSRYKQQQKQQDRDRHGSNSSSSSNQKQQQQQSLSQNHHQTIQDSHLIMMQHQQQQQNQSGGFHPAGKASSSNRQMMDSSKLPSPFCKQHTSIPTPGLSASGVSCANGANSESNRPVVNGGSSSSLSSIQHHHHHSFPQHQNHHGHGPVSGSAKLKTSGIDKGRSTHPYSSSGSLNVKPTSGNSSRSTSPSSAAIVGGNISGGSSSGVSGIPHHSFIPQPRSSSSIPSAPSSARSSLHEKHLPNNAKIPTAGPTGTQNSTTPTSKSSSSSRTQNNNQVNSQHHGSNSNNHQQVQQQAISASTNGKGSNSSMLEKFKFFKEKDKGEKLKGSGSSTASSSSNKRTSSSSGFSSARSERSDSSVSLSSETKTGGTEGAISSGVIYRNRGGDRGDNSGGSKSSHNNSDNSQVVIDSSSTSTPRLAIKGFRQKLGKAIAPGNKESSPSSSGQKNSHYSGSSSSPKASRKENGDSSHGSKYHHHSANSNVTTSSGNSSGHKSKSSSNSRGIMTKNGSSGTAQIDSPSSSSQNLTATSTTPIENGSSGSAGGNHAPSFLRQPKNSTGSAPARESKNRVSGTGIPTRNSLIGGSSLLTSSGMSQSANNNLMMNNSNSNNQNSNNNNINNSNSANNNLVQGTCSVSTSSLNSTSSSTTANTGTSSPQTTNGMPLQQIGNGTGIPKPTAAVKGTTKQQPSSKQTNENSKVTRTKGDSDEGQSDGNNEIKPEVTSFSSSDSRSNLSQNSFSSEKSLCSNNGGGTGVLNKTSTSSSLKSNDAAQSSPSGNGITVALVSPMPSLTNSVSNTASVSSIESTNGLTHSQFSTSSISQSNSNSNSSDVTIMLASKYQQQIQQSSSEEILDKSNTDNAPPEITSPTSGSTSMGSLKGADCEKIESSSSEASPTSPTCAAPEENSDENKVNGNNKQNRCDETNETKDSPATVNDNKYNQENGNSVIPECEEDDLMLNVKPMEPIMRNSPYGYIKSPPMTGNSPAFFQSSGHGHHKTGVEMRRAGSCENGNGIPPGSRGIIKSAANRQAFSSNPYCDPARVMGRRPHPPPPGSFPTSGYVSSVPGDYDYADINNFDMAAAGYLSDGDLISGNSSGHQETNRLNDGYMSESGVSIYGRRVSNHHQQPNGSSGAPSVPLRSNNSKHGVITEDSFDDSSSISSGISDLNEIPTDLTSSSVNSEVSSPYESLQRGGILDDSTTNQSGGGVGFAGSKGLNSLSKSATKKLESHNQQQNIIYRVVGSRSSGRRSAAADTSDLNQTCRSPSNSPSFAKVSNLPHSQVHVHQNRSATLPVGFVDPSRIVSGKGLHKNSHLVSNLRGSESSNSLRRVASPVASQSSLLSPGGDYASTSRVVSRVTGDKGHHHHNHSSGVYANGSSTCRSSADYGNNGASHRRSMNNLDPKGISNNSARKGMIGIKEDHYLGKDDQTRQRSSGASPGSSSSSSGSGGIGNSENGRRSSKVGQDPGPQHVPAPAPGGTYGFMRRPVNGSSNGGSAKYAVPVTSAGSGTSNGKMSMSGVRDHQMLVTGEDTYHVNPYSVMQQQQNPQSPAAQSPKTRTKVKISGGTQTTSDLHEMGSRGNSGHSHGHASLYAQHHQHHMMHHHPHHSQTLPGHGVGGGASEGEYASSTCSRNSGSFAPSLSGQQQGSSSSGYKSLSLTTPTAAQLSQSLRERILGSQSLPKGATSSADYAAILAAIQNQQNQQIYGTPNASRERMSRYATAAAVAAAQQSNSKNLMNDGSLSDAGGYAAYSEIYAQGGGIGGGSSMASGTTPYSWMRHSTGYASSITSAPTRLIGAGGSMTEAESMESLSSTSSLAVQLRDARSNSLTQARISSAQTTREREQGSPSRSPRLNRSNSISHFRERTFPRSTKSEKLYPSMMQRNEDQNPYYSSTMSATGVPTSPIHGPMTRITSGAGGPAGPYSSAASASSNHSVRLSMSPYSGFLAKLSAKEDDINASSLSLVSTASSLYSSQEDKHAHEVRKLRRELAEAQEKVQTLTNQLTTNAHVVAAFEQSLSNMTQRLQTLTLTAEQKDSELNELRQTIDLLRKQSVEAGLTVAQMTGVGSHEEGTMARQLSADSVSSINSISSACSGTSHSHTSSPSGQIQMTPSGTPTHSVSLNAPDSPGSKKKAPKGKGWLRSSFTKAFSRSKSKSRHDTSPEHIPSGGCNDGMLIDHDGQLRQLSGDANGSSHLLHVNAATLGQTSQGSLHRTIPQAQNQHHLPPQSQNGGMRPPGMPTSPLLSPPMGDGRKNNSSCSVSTGSHSPRSNGGGTVSHDGRSRGSSSGLSEEPVEEGRSVDDLKKQLREKEMVLTDIRLEALTSAHQLESLKETVTKMRNEMLSLKQDNERLQRMVTCKSLTSSQTSLQLTAGEGIDRRLSASEVPPPSSTTLEMFLTGDATEKEGKRITVTVYLGSHGSYERYISPVEGLPAQECIIGTISVSNKTKWDALDSLVKRAFKEYLMRIDPMSSLGLSADSVLSYAVGEVLRTKDGTPPELLPCGYLVGDVTKVRVCLRGALQGALDALAFETLIPKSVLQRYMTLIGDNGRIIICGPSGTGKSYLARKLGEYLVARSGKDPCPEAIASFSADHKNTKELRQYLSNLVEQCDGTAGIDLPSVIILDNLHQVQNLGDVFNGVLLNSNKQQSTSFSPVIIGTMTQSANTPPSALQLHHNFRWILFGNHMEPVKGLLSRYLQRRLIEVDTQNGSKNIELARIVDWLPKAWHHVNKFLESHNSADVTIGPRLFLSCPMDVANSQVWFTDLWHYSVVPYLIEAVKEGLQMYGKKAAWEDPSQHLILSYPWAQQLALNTGKSSLQRIRPEDVGYDMKSEDPLPRNSGSANNSTVDTACEPDPLMNMLMRLQEAANYTGPQSNDSDTTSLDSHVSLDSKDYIAT